MEKKQNASQSYLTILLLVLSGEAIFILPFVLARVFRPTFLSAFDLTNTELGFCFSIYGFVAIASYFLGGPLADRFAPGRLMATALILTGLGGFYMASFPSYSGMLMLFGYWGMTTILLFWAGMIKATRVWGGNSNQVRAFGLLEGGRGLVAAVIGSVCLLIFTFFISSENIEEASFIEKRNALRGAILFSSSLVIVVGFLVFLFLKSNGEPEREVEKKDWSRVSEALKIRSVWLLMIIVLCAYVGYKVTSIIPQYANEIGKYDEVESAGVGTFLLYLRPFAAILIVLFLKSKKAVSWLKTGFIIMGVGALLFASGLTVQFNVLIFLFSVFVLCLGIYGTRTLYFAVMKHGAIPIYITGTAVGLISVIGYTPDVFMGPLIGFFLDGFEGEHGYRCVFLFLLLMSFIGFWAALEYQKEQKRNAVR